MKTFTKTLSSGLRIAVCEMPDFEGCSFRMYIFTGSGNEKNEKDYGISHLIEHMFFKGTKTRSALQIVQELDKLGIQNNAYTSKDTTCYYTYGIKDTLEKSVEILSDMLFNSTFDEVELEKEKQVVIEEILMYQDRPDAVCEMQLDSIFYNGTSFAHDIAGGIETVKNITRKQILSYIKRYYQQNNIILSFAGNITLKEAEKLTNKYFNPYFKSAKNFEYKQAKNNYKIKKQQILTKKDTNQAQIMIAYKTDNRFEVQNNYKNVLISQMLGGGMSSRLFQEVREKLGLVYSINSYCEANNLAGLFAISFGTTLKKVKLALKTIKTTLNEVVNKGFTNEELNQAKNMCISSLKLRSDSPSNQSSKIAINLQYANKIKTKEELINDYKNISLEQINNHAKQLFNAEYCISMVSKNDKLNLIEIYDSI